MGAPFLRSEGICPICERESVFEAPDADLREKYKCTRCQSLPRERALIAVLAEMFPNWRDLRIHECSPGSVSADKLWRDCRHSGRVEHLFEPCAAAREIMRTLKPSGVHIFTVPLTRKWAPSRRRARKTRGAVEHMLPPEYHVDPFNREAGALVTIDWGYDIADILDRASGSSTTIFQINDITRGLRALYNEVLVSRKGTKFPRWLGNLSHI